MYSMTSKSPVDKPHANVRVTTRFQPEVHAYVEAFKKTEGINSYNEAINEIVSRYHHQSKTPREINERILVTTNTLRLIAERLADCEEREARIIALLETGMDDGGRERSPQALAHDKVRLAEQAKTEEVLATITPEKPMSVSTLETTDADIADVLNEVLGPPLPPTIISPQIGGHRL